MMEVGVKESQLFLPSSRDSSFRGVQERQGEGESRVPRLLGGSVRSLLLWFENPIPTSPLKGTPHGGRKEINQTGQTPGDEADGLPVGDARRFAARNCRVVKAQYLVESPTIWRT